MRLFIAIQLNDRIRTSLDEVQRRLIRQGVHGNFTPPDNLHLTLAFIGEYPDPDDVMQALEAVSFQPFSLGLEGFGSFGDLWWAGLSDSGELEALVRRIRHALSGSGIPFDRKRFSPHITLIRKASYSGRGKLPEIAIPPESMTVDHVSLMRSDRGKHGMIYTELGTVPQA
jgi:2'-5' RNA ligase